MSNKFINMLLKAGFILAAILIAFLIAAAAILIFAPGIFISIIRYAVIAVCLCAAAYLLWSVIIYLISVHRSSNEK